MVQYVSSSSQSTEAMLEHAACELKRLYCAHRSNAQQVDFHVSNKKWDKYFLKAARVCLTGGYNLGDYIGAQFHALKPWPSIPVACHANAEARYIAKRSSYMQTVVTGVRVQMSILEKMVNIRSIAELLTDGNLEFDSLFTHVVATIYDLTGIIRDTSDAALKEYLTCDHYDIIYGDMLPQWLKDRRSEIKLDLQGGPNG